MMWNRNITAYDECLIASLVKIPHVIYNSIYSDDVVRSSIIDGYYAGNISALTIII